MVSERNEGSEEGSVRTVGEGVNTLLTSVRLLVDKFGQPQKTVIIDLARPQICKIYNPGPGDPPGFLPATLENIPRKLIEVYINATLLIKFTLRQAPLLEITSG